MPKLPFSPVPVTSRNPSVLILYGDIKIGKTAVLADLENNLIIDLEKGATDHECLRVEAETQDEFYQIYNDLEKLKESDQPFPYQYITIDTIDRLIEWFEETVVKEWNAKEKARDVKSDSEREYVKVYSEINWGKGYDLVRLKVRKFINIMRKLAPHLILVAHLKRTLIGETKIEVKEDNLDLVGKLRNLICADADAVGYCFRGTVTEGEGEDEKRLPTMKVSFRAAEFTAAGSRRAHLRGKIIPLSVMTKPDVYKNYWTKIYPDT